MALSAYKQYQTNSINTASPGQLLLMLIDGAVRFAMQAEATIEQGDAVAARHLIGRVQAIIEELMATVNVEAGGEIAQNLVQLYEYMNYRLIQASLRHEVAPVQEVRQHLQTLRSAWAEASRAPGPVSAGAVT